MAVITVPGRPPVGTHVQVWVDRAGEVVTAPPTRTGAMVLGVMSAVGVVASADVV
jgi:hypothetical protein